jgi:transcription elongation factor GreA
MHRLSTAAHAELVERLAELTGPKRVELAAALEEARKAGKLEENPDYFVVRAEQDLLERRIEHLVELLSGCVVSDEVPDDGTVAIGSRVTVRFEADEQPETLLLGEMVERSVSGEEICSPASPLGQALLGARAGDEVSYRAPSGVLLTVIVEAVC